MYFMSKANFNYKIAESDFLRRSCITSKSDPTCGESLSATKNLQPLLYTITKSTAENCYAVTFAKMVRRWNFTHRLQT